MELINELTELKRTAPNHLVDTYDLAIKWLNKYLTVKGNKAEERVALRFFKQCVYRLGIYDEWVNKLQCI